MALPPAEVIAHDEIRAAVKAYEEAKARRWAAWQAMTDIAGTRDAALLDVVAESQSKMAAAESFRGFVRSGRWWAHPTDHGVDGAISTLRGAYAPAVEVEEPTAA